MAHTRKKARLKTLLLGYYTVKPVQNLGRGKWAYKLTELKPTKFPKRKYSGKWKFIKRENNYDTYQEIV